MESGRLHLERESVALGVLIERVVYLMQAQAAERGVTLHMEMPANLPPLYVDPDRIQQVLLNLVSNAVKYNREGGKVEIKVQHEDTQISISVQDTGIGISQESLAHLFERFYRVPDSAEKSEGSGLGLAIAKKIIEDHGGHIHVQSELGVGSQFECVFPLLSENELSAD